MIGIIKLDKKGLKKLVTLFYISLSNTILSSFPFLSYLFCFYFLYFLFLF